MGFREHIYRCHKLSPRCGRCTEEFQLEEELEAHTRQPEPCRLNSEPDNDPSRGINKAQEVQLRSRKRRSNQTEEDKWRDIYLILFPGEEHSMPYPCRPFCS
jgi:hypothetical protein